MVPLINKTTRVTRHSINAIDHIITNSVADHNDLKSAILKNEKIFCTTETGMTLKKLQTPKKHISTFSIYLLTFMARRSKIGSQS